MSRKGGLVNENEAAASEEMVALDTLEGLALLEDEWVATPEAFLTGVSAVLKASGDVDVDLAAILSDHLLTVTPNANVIVNAKAAILALAAKRAAPAEKEVDG